MNASRKLKALVAATCLAATSGVIATTMAPGVAGASTEVNVAGSSGTHPVVKMSVSCLPGGGLRANVRVDQNSTGFQTVSFRTYYVKWQKVGSTWVNRGSVWISSNWVNTYTDLLGYYVLGYGTTVPAGYTYTVAAEVAVGNLSHRYYEASPGEYWWNMGTPISGTGCTF